MAIDIYDAAIEAYESGDAESAKRMIDQVIDRSPDSPEGISLRHIRARAYEFGGYPGGVDLDKAYLDYHHLEKCSSTVGSDALVGAARVLFDLDGAKNKEEIQRVCLKAISSDKNVYAKMLLGFLNEKVLMDSKVARKWYLSAYFGGLPWGLRYFADSHSKDGNKVRAAVCHALTSITSPFLVLIFGVRGVFSEHP